MFFACCFTDLLLFVFFLSSLVGGVLAPAENYHITNWQLLPPYMAPSTSRCYIKLFILSLFALYKHYTLPSNTFYKITNWLKVKKKVKHCRKKEERKIRVHTEDFVNFLFYNGNFLLWVEVLHFLGVIWNFSIVNGS